MSNLVIVAIPDENDRVWKVSSEKVPHLTVLFLGDVDQVSNLETVVQFVEHAANTTLRRFYLPVDRRGELGEDKADVLFFKKGRYDYKAIRDFRAALLQDHNIKTAYDSTEQHEGPWQPHLTLGYPGAPAKPDDTDRDYGFYDVGFNKIAVWMGDFEGPEFLLKDYWDEWDALETVPMDVAMSDLPPVDDVTSTMERGAAFLAHYGVKGMRWGVRKQDPTAPVEGSAARALFLRPARQVLPHLTTGAKLGVLVGGAGAAVSPGVRAQLKEADRQIKLQKLDKQWKKQFTKNKRFVDVHNSAADEMDKFLPGHNKKYKDVDFTKPENKAAYKKYEDEYMKEFSKQYGLAAEKIYGTSPTGRSKVTYDHDTGLIKITTKNVKHAAEDDNGDEIAFFLAETDDTGHIIKNYPILPAPDDTEGAVDEIAQSVDLGAVLVANLLNGDELEHYGVKGMRWGVRRETEVTTQTHVDTGLRRRRTRVRTEGGESQPAHHDAVKAAVAKQIVKKSGTDALSTQELRDLANRLQVENQVGILMSSKGKQFVAKEFESGSKKVLKKGAKSGAKVAGPHVLKRAAKPLATAATTAALAL